ncbi:DUF6000 family protein [Amycolatopsis thermoflava]|uniref:DUF6000 family protein n=1 Tax=Amycolatopsis thermoflava TaxID=84480 RepID=UPI003F4A09C5
MRDHREEPELGRIVNRYVIPGRRYHKLFFGPIARMTPEERARFGHALAEDARQVTDDELNELLDYEYRARLTAAWLIALDRRATFRERLGELLLASEFGSSGKGYCFALARFGTEQDAQLLLAYLDRYLPRVNDGFDVAEAMGALLFVEAKLGTRRADRFLQEGGLWERWAELRPSHEAPDDYCRHTSELNAFADEWMVS